MWGIDAQRGTRCRRSPPPAASGNYDRSFADFHPRRAHYVAIVSNVSSAPCEPEPLRPARPQRQAAGRCSATTRSGRSWASISRFFRGADRGARAQRRSGSSRPRCARSLFSLTSRVITTTGFANEATTRTGGASPGWCSSLRDDDPAAAPAGTSGGPEVFRYQGLHIGGAVSRRRSASVAPKGTTCCTKISRKSRPGTT